MNILFVVPYAPTPIRVRPYSFIRALSRRGHHLAVATVWESEVQRQALAELAAEGIEVWAAQLRATRKLWNCARALPTGLPLQAAFCHAPALERSLLGRLADRHRPPFDVAHVEHLRGVRYALRLREIGAANGTLPVVWDSVDCISHLFEQARRHSPSLRSKLTASLELGRTKRCEAWLAGQFTRVLVTSPVDKAALEGLGLPTATSPIDVVPNGVDLDRFCPPVEEREPDTLVFSGKMSYHANVAAALYLVRDIMPLVWASRPQTRLVIAGSRPPSVVTRLASSDGARVEVTGFVPDMSQPLRSASVAVAPLVYGAGIQNKVLEAMACATPVVASPLAASGLTARVGDECLVADGPRPFAEAVLSLLADRGLRDRVGAAGRAYVERHHTWDGSAARLEAIYEEVAQSRR